MPGVTPEQLLDTARRAKVASADMTAEGTQLTYLSAILLSVSDHGIERWGCAAIT
jgi:hypothetical protein